MLLRPPTSTLFPYTTLFRSLLGKDLRADAVPLPFRLPFERVAQRGGVVVELVREEEGQWAEGVGGGVGRRDDRGEEFRGRRPVDRKSTRLNSSHSQISYAVF